MFNFSFNNHNCGDILRSRYQIIEQLGQGGFGCTYLAKNMADVNESLCVVKQLKPMFNSPSIWEDATRRFIIEANTLRNLGFHPQIPLLIDHFQENEEFYLVQEFIDGQELDKEIKNQVFDEIKVIHFLHDVLEILSFVHEHGVIHRDIKPANLIRRKSDGKIVLIDFGAVKEITTLSFNPQTQKFITKAVGTMGYWAPEQQLGNPVCASDIFALGRTAIYALTGINPVDLEDDCTGEIKNWFSKVSGSAKLTDILNTMILTNHKERYQKASDVLTELKPLLKIGQSLAKRYEITSYLGGSLWSNSYLAIDRESYTDSGCVIKQLKPQANNSEELQHIINILRSKFQNLIELKHKQIPKLYQLFEENKELYVVEEFIEGDSLSQEIKTRGKLSEQQVINLLKDVLEILDYIHKYNQIHLNINPFNLIRRRSNGKYVLIDWGQVKQMLTFQTSWFVGIEGYIPPEQMVGKPVFSSDLYALGMTATYALTGLTPEDLPIDQQTGKLLWQESTKVDKKLAKVIDKMLCLDLNQRYKSAADVLRELNPREPRPQPIWKYVLILTVLIFLPVGNKFWQYLQVKKIFTQGNQLFNQEQYDKAIEKYNQVLELDSRYYQALTNAGIAKGKLGQYEEMEGYCNLSLAIDENSPIAWNCKAEALIHLKKYQQAVAALDKAIALNPQETAFLINKSEALLKLKQFPEAYENSNSAIALLEKNNSNPDLKNLAIAYSYNGWALRELKQFEQAIRAYEQALKYNSDDYLARLGKAIILWKTQELQKATEEFDLLLSNSNLTQDQKAEVLYYNGLILCQKGLLSEGKATWQEALKINPELKSDNENLNICQ